MNPYFLEYILGTKISNIKQNDDGDYEADIQLSPQEQLCGLFSCQSFQDWHFVAKSLLSIRTSPITEQEVKEWHEADAWLGENWENMRQRVKIIDPTTPYCEEC